MLQNLSGSPKVKYDGAIGLRLHVYDFLSLTL